MGNKLGKSAGSKLKKRRTQSITWSFRYGTLKKKMPPIMVTYPHLEIGPWLELLELQQYEGNFSAFTGVEHLLELSERDIKKLGVLNSAHRARIVSSLYTLREKQQKTSGVTNSTTIHGTMRRSTQRHSLAVDPSNGHTINRNTNNNSCSSSNNNNNNNISPKHGKSIDGSTTSIKTAEDPSIYEVLNVAGSKQSKSCGDLLEMEASSPDAQESIALKKALEWELSLDSRDLRSHAWYHGPIPRQRAEEIVQKEGDFLIRDCASQPGNYVLTCRGKSSVLHFVINKILIQPETVYERVQFQFEDDAYDTVPDLITFYVGSGKPISVASGARIQFPCNRTYPLSFYGNKFGNHAQMIGGARGASPLNSPSLVNAGIRFNPYNQQGNYNSYRSPMSSPPRTKRETPPRLPSKKQRSQSLTPIQASIAGNNQGPDKYNSADGVITNTEGSLPGHTSEARRLVSGEKSCSADGVIQQAQQNGNSHDIMIRSTEEKSTSADGVINHSSTTQVMSRSTGDTLKFSSHSLPRLASGNLRLATPRTSSLNRDASDTSLSPCVEQNQFGEADEKPPSPPPKPSRTPSNPKRDFIKDLPLDQHPLNRIASYHASGSDSGNGSGDSAHSSAAGDPLETTQHRGVIIKNPRFMTNSASSMTLKSFSDFDIAAAEQVLASMEIPVIEQVTKYDIENFQTLLLPTVENKPLDNGALNTFRMMLAEAGPRIIAQHLTRIDIKLILGELNKSTLENPLDCSGLELLTLPQGRIFRDDLVERTQCLKLLVAVTILTCQSDLERAETLNKWIQVAIDTKTALGNLFGFCSIMLGLCMPQVQKLEPAWHVLRQKYTDSAFNFEAKLRPTLKSMNDCSNPQAPNTTVPHLLPYILLKDRGIDDILGSASSPQPSLVTSCICPWESSADDFGISILFTHLDSARNFTKNVSLYKRNAQIVLSDSNARLDELLADAFRTEFHIKFLWGSKGALAPPEDRHSKLEQVLALMAEKFCGCEQIGSAA